MSLASDYAQACEALQVPAPFAGNRIKAEVAENGNARIEVDGSSVFEAPPQALLAFAAWINATFGDAS